MTAETTGARAGVDGVTMRMQFTRDAYERLRRLMRETNRSEGELLSDALALEQLVTDIRRQGGRLLTEQNGHYRELLPA